MSSLILAPNEALWHTHTACEKTYFTVYPEVLLLQTPIDIKTFTLCLLHIQTYKCQATLRHANEKNTGNIFLKKDKVQVQSNLKCHSECCLCHCVPWCCLVLAVRVHLPIHEWAQYQELAGKKRRWWLCVQFFPPSAPLGNRLQYWKISGRR